MQAIEILKMRDHPLDRERRHASDDDRLPFQPVDPAQVVIQHRCHLAHGAEQGPVGIRQRQPTLVPDEQRCPQTSLQPQDPLADGAVNAPSRVNSAIRRSRAAALNPWACPRARAVLEATFYRLSCSRTALRPLQTCPGYLVTSIVEMDDGEAGELVDGCMIGLAPGQAASCR